VQTAVFFEKTPFAEIGERQANVAPAVPCLGKSMEEKDEAAFVRGGNHFADTMIM